jgi:hypothetical protein
MDDILEFRLSRDIEVQTPGGESFAAKLCIGGIHHDMERDIWECEWAISLLPEFNGKIVGVDALGALVLCIKFCDSLLSDGEFRGYKIFWDGELGCPLL